MPIQLSEKEKKMLHLSWLATTNLCGAEFRNAFKPIINQIFVEVEDFIKKCGYSAEIRKVQKLALTLKPTRTFGFSPSANGFLFNLWYLFFCNDEKTAFIKPVTYRVAEFFHEYSHYKFCYEYNMIGQDSKKTEKFLNDNFIEIENLAYTEEISFLEKAVAQAPDETEVRAFNIKSWTKAGNPLCRVTNSRIRPKIKLEMDLLNAKALRTRVTSSPKAVYNKVNIENMKSLYSDLALILKLRHPNENDPILDIDLKELVG